MGERPRVVIVGCSAERRALVRAALEVQLDVAGEVDDSAELPHAAGDVDLLVLVGEPADALEIRPCGTYDHGGNVYVRDVAELRALADLLLVLAAAAPSR